MRHLTRWLVGALGAVLTFGCANRGGLGPPGGPVDPTPPRVTLVTPESGSVNQRAGSVRFEFNKVINDNPSGGQLDRFFLISPTDGDPRVNWHRDRIDVRPRHGFRANTAYTVTLLPGLADVRGNQMKQGGATVFSTGATIPQFGILGTIFDWTAERPAGGALIEAISRPDSVLYITAADSLGQYVVGPLKPGRYTLLGFLDRNNNRILDNAEMWDSATVIIGQVRPVVELLAISRDTFPPRMTAASREDSATMRVTFDRALDPKMPLTPALFRLQKSDSTQVAIASVIGARAAADSAARRDSTRRDSTARRDTTVRRDTTARRDTIPVRAAAPPGAPPSIVPLPAPTPARAPAGQPAGPRLVPRIGTAPPPPKPSVPGPESTVLLKIASPALLEPGVTYRVTARNVRNIVGRAGTSTRTVTMPKVPLPTAKDSLKRDSTRVRDTTRTAPPRRPPSHR
ncbi:MAG TPA: Ig-like domain-containing protein [Gemmatimonadaceae bacterium]